MTDQLLIVRSRTRTCCGTDGTDLLVSDPNSGVRRRGRLEPEPAADGDDGLLQLADVPANALRDQIRC